MRKFPNIELGDLQLCNRDTICNAIVDNCPKVGALIVEIGVFRGKTLQGLCQLLQTEGFTEWKALGIDLDRGPWRFNCEEVLEKLGGYPVEIDTSGSPHALRNNSWLCREESINFLHIDGCHSQACVTQDFVVAETLIAIGGIVAFHDADTHCQGPEFDIQPHCGAGCEVRKALHCLGLLNNTRPGWHLLAALEGEPSGPRHGRGSVIVQKSS